MTTTSNDVSKFIGELDAGMRDAARRQTRAEVDKIIGELSTALAEALRARDALAGGHSRTSSLVEEHMRRVTHATSAVLSYSVTWLPTPVLDVTVRNWPVHVRDAFARMRARLFPTERL